MEQEPAYRSHQRTGTSIQESLMNSKQHARGIPEQQTAYTRHDGPANSLLDAQETAYKMPEYGAACTSHCPDHKLDQHGRHVGATHTYY